MEKIEKLYTSMTNNEISEIVDTLFNSVINEEWYVNTSDIDTIVRKLNTLDILTKEHYSLVYSENRSHWFFLTDEAVNNVAYVGFHNSKEQLLDTVIYSLADCIGFKTYKRLEYVKKTLTNIVFEPYLIGYDNKTKEVASDSMLFIDNDTLKFSLSLNCTEITDAAVKGLEILNNNWLALYTIVKKENINALSLPDIEDIGNQSVFCTLAYSGCKYIIIDLGCNLVGKVVLDCEPLVINLCRQEICKDNEENAGVLTKHRMITRIRGDN